MSQPMDVSPVYEDGHSRWARVKRVLPSSKQTDISKQILRAMRLVATVTNNRVLQFKLNPNTSNQEPDTILTYLRSIIADLKHRDFLLLLGFLRNEDSTYNLTLKRPKLMGDWQTIFSLDFVQGNAQKLSEQLDIFHAIKTKIQNAPDGIHAPVMLVNSIQDAWAEIGALKINQEMTLLQFVETLKDWSKRNGNQPIYFCDDCLPLVICKTKAGHDYSIIDFIKFLQEHEQDPAFKNILFLKPSFFKSTLTDSEKAQEHENSHNTDEFYIGEDIKKIRKIVTPADAVVIMEYEKAIQKAAVDISDYLPHAHSTLIFEEGASHTPFAINAESSLAPMLGMVGVYQATYSASANNALLRDAYTRYQKAIEDLTAKEIAKILAKSDKPSEQIELMRQKAKDKMLQSIFRETFFTGATISVFLATILGLFLGTYAPFALIPAGLGVVVSGMTALWNKHLLETKLNQVMKNDEVDSLIVTKLEQYEVHKLQPESELEKNVLNKVSLGSALVTFSTRIVTLASAASMLIAPIVFSIAAAIKLPINWRKTNLHLKVMRENPLAAMYAAREINIEPVSATAHSFMRNDFRKFLLEKIGPDELEHILKQHRIEVPKTTSTTERGIRFVLSSVGLWDKEYDYNLIEALYDPNPKSVVLLRQLRKECKDYVLTKRLEMHLKKYGDELGLKETTLLELRKQCEAGKLDHYNILMKDYLEKTAVENVEKVVMNTGMYTTILASVIVVGLTMTYSPIALLALPAIVPLIAIGYGISKLAAHVEMQKMRTAIKKKVPAKDIEDLLAHTRKLELPHDRGLYAGVKDRRRVQAEESATQEANNPASPTVRSTLLAHKSKPDMLTKLTKKMKPTHRN